MHREQFIQEVENYIQAKIDNAKSDVLKKHAYRDVLNILSANPLLAWFPAIKQLRRDAEQGIHTFSYKKTIELYGKQDDASKKHYYFCLKQKDACNDIEKFIIQLHERMKKEHQKIFNTIV